MIKSVLINILCVVLSLLTHYLLAISLSSSSNDAGLYMKLILDIPGIQFGNALESWSIIIKNLFILFVLFRVLIRLIDGVIFPR